MGDVVSFKVSRTLKERMDRFKGRVRWSEELRRFLESRVAELEAEAGIQEVVDQLSLASWSVPAGFAQRAVREDRDRR
jgi:hypothetical protein